jgi:hypothetical protein
MASPLEGAAMLPTAVPGLDYAHGWVLEGELVDVEWEERGRRGWTVGRSRTVPGTEIWLVQSRGGGCSENFLSNCLNARARLASRDATTRRHKRITKKMIALKREDGSTHDLQGPHCSSSCR